MNPFFYLLSLNICGIKNIEEPIQLDFYKKTINKDFNPSNFKIKAIYGENGSGKTAIISSVKLLRNLLLDRSYLADNNTQNTLAELINKKTRKGYVKCEFFYEDDGTRKIFDYFIAFEINDDDRFYITEERFRFKKGNYSKNNFVVISETKNGCLQKFGNEEMFDFFKNKTQNLLSQQTFLSSILNLSDIPNGFQQTDEFFMQFLLLIFAMSLLVYIDEADNHINHGMMKRFQQLDESGFESYDADYVKRFVKEARELGREEIIIPKYLYANYVEQVNKLKLFIQIFKADLLDIEIEKKDYDQSYKCNLRMVYKNYSLDQEFESRGIKKLMDLFYYLDAASSGLIVFIDELDSSINDVYLDKIIEFFVYHGKGQLCFTSHNLSPMSVLKGNRNAINFISSINTVHTWSKCGNLSPENAYKKGFIEDSPFNVDASDFLGILGGVED